MALNILLSAGTFLGAIHFLIWITLQYFTLLLSASPFCVLRDAVLSLCHAPWSCCAPWPHRGRQRGAGGCCPCPRGVQGAPGRLHRKMHPKQSQHSLVPLLLPLPCLSLPPHPCPTGQQPWDAPPWCVPAACISTSDAWMQWWGLYCNFAGSKFSCLKERDPIAILSCLQAHTFPAAKISVMIWCLKCLFPPCFRGK